MKVLKRVNLLILISFFASSISVAPVSAMQTGTANTMSLDGIGNFIKNIFTLDYLNGENGEFRNSTLLEKAAQNPDRAVTTVAAYALLLFAAKKAYDFADQAGIFDPVILPEPQARRRPAYQMDRDDADFEQTRITRPQVRVAPDRYENDDRDENRQPVQHPVANPVTRKPARNSKPGSKKTSKSSRSNKPAKKQKQSRYVRPAQKPVNNPAPRPAAPDEAPVRQPRDRRQEPVRIANPLPGQQVHLNGIPNLPGFYHMLSQTPYHAVRDSCGVQSAYNMAQVEARTFGRQLDEQEFRRVQEATFPQLGHRGASNTQVARMTRELGLGRMGLLLDARRNRGGVATIEARAAEFHRANGPQVVHFLCEVPGHWIAISIVRNAAGEQAMYLYDNMNQQARSIPEMRQHVENVYNRFF